MEISKKYVVYELNKLLESSNLTLERVEFKGWVTNSFDTEEEAIQALINDNKIYCDYYILKEIFIRNI
jgi:hypothetical protein